MKKKGFTLIELLVVIAIIGLLSTLAVVALNSARQRARDARRVADVKQIQTALELYYNDQDEYPAGNALELGEGTDCTGSAACVCLDADGFDAACTTGIYMGSIPASPDPNGDIYTYTGLDAAGADCATTGEDCDSYSLTFNLEGSVGSLGSGTHTASPTRIQ